MATIKPIDDWISMYTRMVPSRGVRRVVQWSLDARRALIFFPKKVKPGYVDPAHVKHLKEQEAKNDARAMGTYTPVNASPFYNQLGSQTTGVSDAVWIIIKDAWGDKPPLFKIKLPFIPTELNYNSESSFAAIKPIGRNTSRYHFTGSEDKLEFEIDWHSFDQGRQDVITNCRLLESLSKSDGYTKSPPLVMLQWGMENHLFSYHEFIVLAASYRLTQFNKSQVINKQFQRTHMMPIQAYQKIVLARVSSNNLTTKDIQLTSKF